MWKTTTSFKDARLDRPARTGFRRSKEWIKRTKCGQTGCPRLDGDLGLSHSGGSSGRVHGVVVDGDITALSGRWSVAILSCCDMPGAEVVVCAANHEWPFRYLLLCISGVDSTENNVICVLYTIISVSCDTGIYSRNSVKFGVNFWVYHSGNRNRGHTLDYKINFC